VPGGCSQQTTEPPIDESIPPEPLMILLDAYRGEDQYFLRYQRGDEVFYAVGDLTRQLREDPPRLERYDLPVVLPIDARAPESWEQLTRGLSPVPVLGVAAWSSLRNELFADFMPTERNRGVAVSFDRVDYFFFIDRAGNFRARRLIDMPPWYSVVERVDLREYFERWQPRLERFLAEAGIDSHEVIFSTGDLDKGSIPFVYVNARDKLIVLVEYDELPEGLVEALPGAHLLQTFWHFVESHTYTLVMRPFSTIRSLLTVVSDTAVETGRGLSAGMLPDGPAPPLTDGPAMDLQRWERELDEHLGRPANKGTLRFLVDGEAFFPRFVDTVASAVHSVDIRTYIFDTDDVALTVGELLKRRSREGVKVRVLFDGLGTIVAGGQPPATLPAGYPAPMSAESFLKTGSRVKVRKVKNPWLTGDHVKTMVIDDQLAFLGGMNIGREYRYEWHDIMVELSGPVVRQISREFDRAWGKAGFFGDFSGLFHWDSGNGEDAVEGYPVRLIHTRPGALEIYELQRRAMRKAQRYIYIENAYFTDDLLLRELIKARRRGVDVRVVIPLETDRGLITRNIAMAGNIMLANGIRVYIYPGFSHAKAAIFDGWVSMGSANLDRLSLRINEEINIATSEPQVAEALIAQLFEPDFRRSTELTEPLPERWSDRLIEMFGDYVF